MIKLEKVLWDALDQFSSHVDTTTPISITAAVESQGDNGLLLLNKEPSHLVSKEPSKIIK